jgi:hypothetical protein
VRRPTFTKVFHYAENEKVLQCQKHFIVENDIFGVFSENSINYKIFFHILPIVIVCIKGDNAQKQFHRAPFSTTQSDRIF